MKKFSYANNPNNICENNIKQANVKNNIKLVKNEL